MQIQYFSVKKMTASNGQLADLRREEVNPRRRKRDISLFIRPGNGGARYVRVQTHISNKKLTDVIRKYSLLPTNAFSRANK